MPRTAIYRHPVTSHSCLKVRNYLFVRTVSMTTSGERDAIVFRASNFIADFTALSTSAPRRATRPDFQSSFW